MQRDERKHSHTRAGGRLVWAAVAAIVLAFASYPVAQAVHDEGLFELGNGQNPTVAGSGDIAANGAQPGPDWAQLFAANGSVVASALSTYGGLDAVFLKDDLAVPGGATDRTVFAGGSDKNNDPISTWTWGTGSVPAKDDLANTYAYGVVDPDTNHTIAYVGLERIVNNGDSHVDIEFFQDDVALDESVPCDASPCHFTGSRTNHDVLVSVDFTKGGDLGTVVVHLYNASTGVYDEVEKVNGEGCNGVAAANLTPDSICAFDNGGDIDGGPWPNYNGKGQVVTMLPRNAFTEFGIDLTNAAGGTTPCISTVFAKTRSSQSFTAELKDFSGPLSFDLCSGGITIGPDGVNPVGAPHTFFVNVTTSVAGVVSPAPDGTTVNVTLTATDGAVVDLASDTCASPGTVGGSCQVTFTSNTTGTVTGHAVANVTIGGTILTLETDGQGGNSDDAVKQFIGRAIVKLTAFGYNNSASDAEPAGGIVNGTTTYTMRFHNYGIIAANLSADLNVSAPGGTGGGSLTFGGATGSPTTAPTAGDACPCLVEWTGLSVAPGGDAQVTATVDYDEMGDGLAIAAALDALYASGGTDRVPSGAPAMVSFTVQSD